jgi:phosphatidylserine synthase
MHQKTVFGKQLDSLADLVSFGVAPAFIYFSLDTHHWAKTVILIAFVTGVPAMAGVNRAIEAMSVNNPLFSGPMADVLSLVPFVALIAVLYLTGREKLLTRPS